MKWKYSKGCKSQYQDCNEKTLIGYIIYLYLYVIYTCLKIAFFFDNKKILQSLQFISL